MTPVLENPAVWAMTQQKVMVWMLVLTRMTGLLALLPGLGQERLPMRVRAAFLFLLATVVTPVLPLPKVLPESLWTLLAFMVVELATGLFLGLLVTWVMEAVNFAGHLMDVQMGFSFMQLLDPSTSRPSSVSGLLMSQIALLFLLISGLHHQMILALVESYRILPLGAGLPFRPLELVAATGLILSRGLQLAFPLLFALFLVDALEGIATKFMPQLQPMQLAFPIKIALGLTMTALMLPYLSVWLAPLFEALPREALHLLG